MFAKKEARDLAMAMGRGRRLEVAFVHPDLGLGGAERLVIDAALGLDHLGHQCTIYTAHLDKRRAFGEVTQGVVRARSVWVPFPRSVMGRLHALLAALRTSFVALWVGIFVRPDVAIVDIVTLPAAVLALLGVPVLFYCHYPDALLAKTLRRAPSGRVRQAYRVAVDKLEAAALRAASTVAVNSGFTAQAFGRAFPDAAVPSVVHPCTDCAVSDLFSEPVTAPGVVDEKRTFVLSLNRYERKKNIGLAIDALALMRSRCRLVIAGGWDARVSENVAHYGELMERARAAGVEDRVRFVRNVSSDERARLLQRAAAVAYTPADEHFGIVPLEAMASRTPVVAVNSGGPTETVWHGVTGFLCKPDAKEFASALDEIVGNPARAQAMGTEGANWVKQKFSRESMAQKLDELLQSIVH